ncbi:MAG: DUF4445 domain-containing protein [Clostridia bacterium]|nr:DUF4445 domain-containing protein [Clostridia bacterium]
MNHHMTIHIPLSAQGIRLSTHLAEAGYPITADCGGRGKCGKCAVTVVSGSFSSTPDGKVPAIPDDSGKLLSCRVFCNGEAVILLPVTKGSGLTAPTERPSAAVPYEACGVALDIGTTTLAAALVHRTDGSILRTTSRLNPQKSFGADVMSRIQAVMENEAHLLTMQKLLLEDVRAMLEALTDGHTVSHMTVAGNPTMLHLFCGISPVGMGTYPFTPVFTDTKVLSGKDLGLPADQIILLPSVSAFIGGDLTAGMIACDITNHAAPVLLVDMGTNGEMILYTGKDHGDKLYGTSTAAGPALEGAGISTGTGGVSGAVSSVVWNGVSLQYETVDHAPPIGICGSGLIDLVSLLLLRGIMDETGYLEEDPFPYAEKLTLTGEDIRAFQLAKSALRAGMEVLCETAGISPQDLSALYIAGGLGQYMRMDSAMQVGLLPDCPKQILQGVGNTALKGAAMALRDPTWVERITADARRCETVALNLSPSFSDKFMEYMLFPEVET